MNAFLSAKTYDDDSNAGSKWDRMTEAERVAFIAENTTSKSNEGSKWNRMTEVERVAFIAENTPRSARTYDDDSNEGSKWDRMTEAEKAAFMEENKTPKSNIGSKWDRMTETEKATFETTPRPARTYDDDSNAGSKWDRMTQAEKEVYVTGGVTRKNLIANYADAENEQIAAQLRLEALNVRERSGGKVPFIDTWSAQEDFEAASKKRREAHRALRNAYIHPVVAKNADALHNKECKADHPSECSYHQHGWEKPGQLRNEYYVRAEEAYINS